MSKNQNKGHSYAFVFVFLVFVVFFFNLVFLLPKPWWVFFLSKEYKRPYYITSGVIGASESVFYFLFSSMSRLGRED